MKIAIEPLQLDELRDYLREQADDAFPNLKDELRLNKLSEKWHSYAEFCTCRNDENCLVGMIAFYANQIEGGIAFMPHVYVSIKYRGQGLMTSMLHVIEGYVMNKGFNCIHLEVRKTNERAQRYYLHCGFSLLDNTLKESYIMCKQLIS